MIDLVTDSAYVYEVYGTKNYLSKMTHASNCGTAGFLISTVVYVVIYHVFNIEGLLLSTIATSMAAAFFSFKLKKEPSKVIGFFGIILLAISARLFTANLTLLIEQFQKAQ